LKLEESSIYKKFFYKKLRAFASSCLRVSPTTPFGEGLGMGANKKAALRTERLKITCHFKILRNNRQKLFQIRFNYFLAAVSTLAVVSAGAATAAVSTGAGVSTGATVVESTGASSLVSPPPHDVNVAAIIAIAKNFFIVVFFLV